MLNVAALVKKRDNQHIDTPVVCADSADKIMHLDLRVTKSAAIRSVCGVVLA